MNKKSVLWIILDLIFLILFNVIFFMVGGTDHPASVWISYAFIHIAYIMLIITPLLIKNCSSKAVFGFALTSISAVYFLAEFVIGIIFVLIAAESYKATLIVQLVVAGIYAIILVANLISNETTAESVEQHEYELQYVKECSARLKALVDNTEDKSLRKKLERAYDALHASPVKSNSRVSAIERDVYDVLDELESAMDSSRFDVAALKVDSIIKLAEERNRKLKASH